VPRARKNRKALVGSRRRTHDVGMSDTENGTPGTNEQNDEQKAQDERRDEEQHHDAGTSEDTASGGAPD